MKRWKFLLAILLTLSPVYTQVIFAQSSSTNYRIEESYIGPGGGSSSSGSYDLRGSLGDAGGFSESTNYGLWAGYNTDGTEYLEMVVTGATLDLGVLSTASTSYASGTFYVRTYPAQNYVVTTESNPPTYGSNTFTTMSGTPAELSPGTEQFGINLVDNATPDVGANPSQYPDSSFAHGIAASGYGTANQYKYTKGDIIAKSDPSEYSWGRTDYTISYVFNISDVTPAGYYTMNHVLVATSTF